VNVKTITLDLASHYDWVCRENFLNAIAVADKFHIIKIVLQAVQDQRIEYRHEQIAKRTELYEQHRIREDKIWLQMHMQKYKSQLGMQTAKPVYSSYKEVTDNSSK